MDPLLRPGDQIGDLLVLEEIGHGSRGVVYKAYDTRLDRNVALKLLRGATGEEELDQAHRRLVKEAQAMAQLSHPSVVTVHDVGTVELSGRIRVFVKMEYVRGQTLQARMAAWHDEPGGPRWTDVRDVFVAAGEGLAAAHDRKLIHRDFKPANVMVDDAGRVMVTDFGLVRRAPDADVGLDATEPQAAQRALDVLLTRTGARVGTPAYMAPEQFDGEPGSAQSDQFAFCVALYEALYGQRPFAGDDLAQLTRAVLEGSPRPPPAGARVPRFVVRALWRGLSRDPAERHRDMHALLDALRADPRARLRRVASGLGVVGGLAALAYAVRRWLEPGVLVLGVVGSGEPPTEVSAWIDDDPVDVDGPVLSAELSAGPHRVRIEARDHHAYTQWFVLERGGTIREDARLVHRQGTVDLDVHPGGTRLQIDDEERGSSLHGLSMDTGTHDLWVSAPGHHEARLRFAVTEDTRTELTAYLAPGIVFEHLGGGLPLGRGALGDADGDGYGDVWNHEYTTLTAYSPRTGRTLWHETLSRDDHAMFLRMVDVDGDGVRDPIVLGVGERGATLRVLGGRRTSGDAPWWTAEAHEPLRLPRPLVPPVVVEHEAGPLIIATSLERDTVTAYDGATGAIRWRRTVEGPCFGLVAGDEPSTPWVAVAHAGGVTVLEAVTGADRWHHRFRGFGAELLEGLLDHDALLNLGRAGGRPWMVTARLDDHAGEDLALAAMTDPGGGPLVGLAGKTGDPVWSADGASALRVHPLLVFNEGDLDDDGRDELGVTLRAPSGTGVILREEEPQPIAIVNGRSGKVLDHRATGEQLGRWPCDGPP
ncbi:MAG: protein kinase, partial [Myxococcales bacterium]|nr:protein kinase [Myxococcales bacterium]